MVMNTSTFKRGLMLLALFAGCAIFAMSCKTPPPLPTPAYVNLDRFMGTWYVHGYTPIVVDKDAYDATEHYERDAKGRIQTTYRFRKGGHEGPWKEFTPVATVHDTETNAEWRMQFIWPFKSTYIILHLADDYNATIIAHPNRKYAWIMTRDTVIEPAEYEAHLQRLEAAGFERVSIQRVPHG